jgi:Arc/MetJ-type ribon-helix-helix transcriptional regulator
MTEDIEAEDQQLARGLEATRDDPEEWSDEPASVVVRPTRSQVVSFRLPLEELEQLTEAVDESGESLSEFIRGAIEMRLRSKTRSVGRRISGPLPSSLMIGGRNAGDDSQELIPVETVAMGD